MRIQFGSDESQESRESNCPETTSTPEEPEIREEVVVRMLDELIDESKEAASQHRLVTRGEGNGAFATSTQKLQSDFMLIRQIPLYPLWGRFLYYHK